MAIRKWKTRSSKDLMSAGYIRMRADECELPDGRIMSRYYVLEFPDWVNVVPVTQDGHIVLIEQYRHASGEIHLELPGGSLTPATRDQHSLSVEPTEDPKRAALRELAEETGYVPEDIRLLQCHYPNPALQNNRLWVYVATGCRLLEDPRLDPFEDIRVVPKPVSEVFRMLKAGEINHSLMVASLYTAAEFLGVR
jgi:8-oxo-dGTP pyrophosphatase MutT (NUDIX family)